MTQDQNNYITMKNRERARRNQAAYRQRNPERVREKYLRYYARQLAAAGYTVTAPATAGRMAV